MKNRLFVLPGLSLLFMASISLGSAACTSKPKQYRTVKFRQDAPQTAQKSKRNKSKSPAPTQSFW